MRACEPGSGTAPVPRPWYASTSVSRTVTDSPPTVVVEVRAEQARRDLDRQPCEVGARRGAERRSDAGHDGGT